ncbi:hypothetical protein KY320_02250 [Candidatus Woesearchaeota archaeon]|nr:hypothetical protein [Candidatus Woesearchaeota archaeon]
MNKMQPILKHIQLIMISALLLLGGCSEERPFICHCASDCESLNHIECEGAWSCTQGKCEWQCTQEGISDAKVDAMLSELIEIDSIEKELDFSELDLLDQQLAVLDNW